ncbi:MAG: hypothetical protein KAX16_06005, partial [Actinomycetia bacterium]|nr:hypothetical protein [Actinomycetes bacterium]
GSIGKLPPFAVGRPAWDNWVIYHARSLGVPVIDATKIVTPVHQNHDYGHVPSGTGSAWEGPEADRNRSLLVNQKHIFTLNDANWLLTPQGLQKPRLTLRRARRLIKTFRTLRSHGSASDI